MFLSQALIFALISPLATYAANDWSQPCFQGVCSYDLTASNNSMPGSMAIYGTEYTVSDITTAAGWEIINCSATAAAQQIRLVCTGEDDSSSGCDHVYMRGAENTVVRLPENCGSGPFARVARAWVPEDQSLPQAIVSRLMRRDGMRRRPEVRAFALDMDFGQVSPQSGDISVIIYGSNAPGVDVTLPSRLPARRMRRAFGDFLDDIVKAVSDGVGSVNEFNQSANSTLPPVTIDESFPIFNTSVGCPSDETNTTQTEFGVSVNVDARANALVSLGVVAAGTLVPPDLSTFVVSADVSADINSTLFMNVTAAGTIDSGVLTLFQVGLPGLSIPGVLTLGPSIKLNAQAKAELDVNLDMAVDLVYRVDNLQLNFPPSDDRPSSGSPVPGDSPLQLSVTPAVEANAVIEAHLIPTLDLGIDALNGIASASIFLELDASATVNLGLVADANVDIAVAPADDADGALDLDAEVDANLGQVQGCVNVTGAIAANAGAQGSFFGLFDAETRVPIFEEEFDLFQRCFGDAVPSSPDEAAALQPDDTSAVTSSTETEAATSTESPTDSTATTATSTVTAKPTYAGTTAAATASTGKPTQVMDEATYDPYALDYQVHKRQTGPALACPPLDAIGATAPLIDQILSVSRPASA